VVPAAESPEGSADSKDRYAAVEHLATVVRAGHEAELRRAVEETAHGDLGDEPCRVRVLAAVARSESSRLDGVEELVEGCYEGSPIRPVLDLLVARAACARGDLGSARRSLRRARRAWDIEHADDLARADLIETRCMLDVAPARYAVKNVKEFLKKYPEAPVRLELEVAYAGLLARTGERRRACVLAREIAIRHPLQPAAAGARELVSHLRKERRCPPRRLSTRVATVRELVRHKAWEAAAADLEALGARLDDPELDEELRAEIEELTLRYLEHNGRRDEAEALLLRKGKRRTGNVWLKVMGLRQADGDLEGALEALRRVPLHPHVRLQREAGLLLDFGRFDEAVPRLRKLIEGRRWPPKEWIFPAAMAEWLGGSPERALEHIGWLQARRDSRRLRYFRALVLRDLGRIDEAVELLAELSEGGSEGYYAILSRSRLSEMGVTSPGETRKALLPLEPTFLRAASAVLPAGPAPAVQRGGEDARIGALLDQAVEELGELLPRLVRAREAWQLGMHEVFRRDLRTAAMVLFRARKARGKLRRFIERPPGAVLDNRHVPRAAWGLRFSPWKRVARKRAERKAQVQRVKDLYALWGDPRMDLMADLLDAAGEPMIPRILAIRRGGARPNAPAQLARRAFPVPWAGDVETLSAQAAVPPAVVHTVMNIESAFHAGAVSRAGARGLFQVMPQTAVRLAIEEGAAPPDLDDLLGREASMALGVRYLGKLVKEFRGQIPLALAGYNAGPHRVKEWLRQRGHLPMDVFVETIPFGQARGYVKKGVSRLTSTLRAHAGVEGLYVSRSLDPNPAGLLDY